MVLIVQGTVGDGEDGGGDVREDARVIDLLRRHVYPTHVSPTMWERIYRRGLGYRWQGGMVCM